MGSGEHVYSVWNYAITFAMNSRVELNPKLLAVLIGSTEERMEEAIEYLCREDPNSTHPEYEGRRMVREGQFQYFLPQWEVYQAINAREKLRESNRARQEKFRGNHKSTPKANRNKTTHRGGPLPGEGIAIRQMENGDFEGADRTCAESLPERSRNHQ